MSYELLRSVTGLLMGAGIPTGEEYPGLERPEIDSPRATVGLRELDAAGGTARFGVHVLSPRLLGGWCCQVMAAQAMRALSYAGLACRTEEMEYNSGCDCFCIKAEAVMAVVPRGEDWAPGSRWSIHCGDVFQPGVISFRATRDQQRRLVGTHWKSEPVGITNGTGGWALELIQILPEEPDEAEEPFELTVRQGLLVHRYTGCCWNETILEYLQSGIRLTRRGFALGREEDENGG